MTMTIADGLLERFCRYVRIDTRADEQATKYPSSPGQLVLGKLLVEELIGLGLQNATQDEHGIVTATIPATSKRAIPTDAWFAHMDTSPETTGTNVKPIVHRNYDGSDITLPGDPTKVLRPAAFPELTKVVGKTVVTTDGTTLLAADTQTAPAVLMDPPKPLPAKTRYPPSP